MCSPIRVSLIMAVAALTCLAGQNAYGQLIPYKASGTNAVFSQATGDFSGVGVATYFGRSFHAGTLRTGTLVTGPTGLLTANFESTSPMVITAANRRDTLQLWLQGQVEFVPLDETFTVFTAVWSAQANVVGGTGRFANVKPGPEPLSVVATNEPFRLTDPQWEFAWTFGGNFRLR